MSSYEVVPVFQAGEAGFITWTFLRPLINVCHRLLLDKMSSDVELFFCRQLGSYFYGKIQRIRVDDCVSSDILVTSVVPQGSHFGPLFFWFVNEITRIFNYVDVFFMMTT
jgi:hypothetical protein